MLSYFWGYIYLSRSISLSNPLLSSSFVSVSKLFYAEVLTTFVILPIILLLIKSRVGSAVFWIALSKVVLSVSFSDYLS